MDSETTGTPQEGSPRAPDQAEVPPTVPPAGEPLSRRATASTPAGPRVQSDPAPPERPERRGLSPIFWGLLLGCGPWIAVFLIFLAILVGGMIGGGRREAVGPRIGLLHITGIITSGGGASSPFAVGGAGSERLVDLLDRAAQDDDIKAIVLRIDSPGGSAVGSAEVYDEIMRLRRGRHKPIVVSMGDAAASGGYYIASSADHIFANPGTLTGSIGVIMEMPALSGLMKRFGVDLNVIKSGKFKDIGNPARPMTPQERALMQAMIMEIYDRFVTAVAQGRHLPKSAVLRIADGRVLTGTQALRYHLVDDLGGLKQAEDYAAKQGGITGKPVIEELGKKSFLSGLFGDSDTSSSAAAAAALDTLRLLADPRIREAARALLSTQPAQPQLR